MLLIESPYMNKDKPFRVEIYQTNTGIILFCGYFNHNWSFL